MTTCLLVCSEGPSPLDWHVGKATIAWGRCGVGREFEGELVDGG